MSAPNLSRITAIVLILLGFVTASSRHKSLQVYDEAMMENRWQLTYNVDFTLGSSQDDEGASVQIAVPRSNGHTSILNEEIIHTNLSATDEVRSSTGTRVIELSATHKGTFYAAAQFDIYIQPHLDVPSQRPHSALSGNARAQFLSGDDDMPLEHPTVTAVMGRMPTAATENEVLQWIFEYCFQDLRHTIGSEDGDRVVWAIGMKEASPLGRARAMVTLCRSAKIPARLVSGFELRHLRDARPKVWVEAFREHHWIPFDPENGYAWQLPSTYLPVQRGGDTVVREKGTEPGSLKSKFSIVPLPPAERVLKSNALSPAKIFNLTRLPLDMHKVLSLTLLLPLGALITAVFRNIVGIRTFGTFAPALLALSFVYASWGTSLVILVIVMGAGILGRSLVERLHLLMVPRMSIMLTLIILCVVFSVSVLDFMMPGSDAQDVLLPLVIITILIERLYVVTEEDGAAFSFQLVVGTLVVSACCYLLLRWEGVGRVILVYPELHFFTLAAFILIGRYTGYRLTELWRFRDLVQSDESK